MESRVKRHVGGAGLHDRQHRDIGPDRPAEEQPDPVTLPDADSDQIAGQLVGLALKIVIAQFTVLGGDRQTVAAAVSRSSEKRFSNR